MTTTSRRSTSLIGTRIRIIDTTSTFCLQVGTVIETRKFRIAGEWYRELKLELADGRTARVTGCEWVYESDFTVEMLVSVQKQLEDNKRRYDSFVARRQAEARLEYVAKRTAPTPTYVRNPNHSPSSRSIGYGEMKLSAAQGERYFSESIYIWTPESESGVPRTEVNWFAIGGVSPEHAIAFANAIIAAANEAIEIRAEAERAAGIVI